MKTKALSDTASELHPNLQLQGSDTAGLNKLLLPLTSQGQGGPWGCAFVFAATTSAWPSSSLPQAQTSSHHWGDDL